MLFESSLIVGLSGIKSGSDAFYHGSAGTSYDYVVEFFHRMPPIKE
jgi:hypothetical protein